MNKITLVILLLGFSLTIQAQGRRGNIEQRVEAKKIGYLTDKLELTPEEAQVFWPLYNMYNDELKSLNEFKDDGSPSDVQNVDAEKEIDALIEREQQKLKTKQEYISKFKKAIGADKTLELLKSERGFKREMLNGIRKRKEKSEALKSKRFSKKNYKSKSNDQSNNDQSYFNVYQNKPNPFSTSTTIGFDMPESKEARFTFRNVPGNIVKEISGNYSTGYNEIEVSTADLGDGNVYYYTFESGDYSTTRKLKVAK